MIISFTNTPNSSPPNLLKNLEPTKNIIQRGHFDEKKCFNFQSL